MGNPNAQQANAPRTSVPAGTEAPPVASAMEVEADPPPYISSPQSHNNPDVVTPMPPVTNPATQDQKAVYGERPNAATPNGAPQLVYPVATPLASLGTRPLPVDCPFCGMRGLTIVEEVHSSMTQYVTFFTRF